MQSVTQKQYALVKGARAVLLDYCASLSAAHFVKENSSFGRGSIRNLLVHVANAYQIWIGQHALQKQMHFTAYEAIETAEACKALYAEIDELMQAFFAAFPEDAAAAPISASLNGKVYDTTPLELFTHVITHEFHHKGQVLSLSRHLGYTPVDTDVIR